MNDSGTNNFRALAPQGDSVDDENAGTLRGITIQNNYINDVDGCFKCSDIIVRAALPGDDIVYQKKGLVISGDEILASIEI